MSSWHRNRDKIEDAVKFLCEAPARLKFRGNIDFQTSLETIEVTASTKGLQPNHIVSLLDVAASGCHAETINSRLIKALNPVTVVPAKAVVKAISWMCTNKPSLNIQCLLVRWILLVYDYIDCRDDIHKLYTILFYFLENQTLLPHMCHLLYLLTRKEDVKVFRVRQLLNLQNKMGPQPYLVGLLSIYKLYYPNLVNILISRTPKVFFKSYDHKWASTIRRIQEENRPTDGIENSALGSERLQPPSEQRLQAPKAKRRKLDPVPIVNSNASVSADPGSSQQSLTSWDRPTIPFVQIRNFKSLLEQMDKVEFPSQMGAVLRCPLLQHLMSTCAGDKVVTSRFSFWLYDLLCEEFFDNPGECCEGKEKLVQMITNCTDFLQEGIPVVDSFLAKYLHTWNGLDHRPHILRLVTRLRIYPFGKLNSLILEPLRNLYNSSSVYFKCQIVFSLCELLRHHAAFEWPRYQEMAEVQQTKSSSSTSSQKYTFLSMFLEDVEKFEPVDAMMDLIKYITKLCLVGLQLEGDNSLLLHCILSFLELVSTLHQMYQVPFVLLIWPQLYARLVFSRTAMAASRSCSILCNYKKAFESLKKLQRSDQLPARENDGTSTITSCNLLILDISNGLWRNKCSQVKPQNPLFSFHPHSINKALPFTDDSFCVYLHQAFLPYGKKFLKEVEPKGHSNRPRRIQSVKNVYLQFLEREQLQGIAEFVSTFITRSRSSSVS